MNVIRVGVAKEKKLQNCIVVAISFLFLSSCGKPYSDVVWDEVIGSDEYLYFCFYDTYNGRASSVSTKEIEKDCGCTVSGSEYNVRYKNSVIMIDSYGRIDRLDIGPGSVSYLGSQSDWQSEGGNCFPSGRISVGSNKVIEINPR